MPSLIFTEHHLRREKVFKTLTQEIIFFLSTSMKTVFKINNFKGSLLNLFQDVAVADTGPKELTLVIINTMLKQLSVPATYT